MNAEYFCTAKEKAFQMSDAYIGQICIFAGNYAPENWHICDGTSLKIQDYEALYSLIGTTYGSTDPNHFSLPDLRGKICIAQGQGHGLTNRTFGQTVGSPTCTLTADTIPSHTHQFFASSQTATTHLLSDGCSFGTAAASNHAVSTYASNSTVKPNNLTQLNTHVISTAIGGGQAHPNIMPYIAINFIIRIQGYYPEFD